MMGKISATLLVVLILIVFSGCANNTTGNAVLDKGDTSLSDVKEKGVLLVGTASPNAPMEFFDEDEITIIGLDVDIINHIASEMGVSAKVIDIPWDNLFSKAQSGEVDVIISSITIREDRQKLMLFSVPYFNAGIVFVTKDDGRINNNKDLEDFNVGFQIRTTIADAALEFLNKDVDSPLIKIYDSSYNNTATRNVFIEDLMAGETDAFATEYAQAIAHINKYPGLKIVGDPFKNDFYGIATELGNDALMDEINRILREMKRSGKLKQLEDKWLR